VELLITVAIIAILAAIAVPMYGKYVRQARTSEAVSNLGAIAMYQETYFSENDQYFTCAPNPAAVPTSSDPAGKRAFSASGSGWANLGRVIPDNTMVAFQYEVLAGKYNSTSPNPGAITTAGLVNPATAVTPGGTHCTNLTTGLSANTLGILATPSSNWYYVTATGDQTGDGICSLFIKVIDRTEVVRENDIE